MLTAYLCFYGRDRKFQRLPHVCGVLELKDTIANSARCNRKSVFQDGGLQTGSTYNSASRQDSNAVPKANPHFRGSQPNATITNSVRCNRKSAFQDGGRQTGISYISASRLDMKLYTLCLRFIITRISLLSILERDKQVLPV